MGTAGGWYIVSNADPLQQYTSYRNCTVEAICYLECHGETAGVGVVSIEQCQSPSNSIRHIEIVWSKLCCLECHGYSYYFGVLLHAGGFCKDGRRKWCLNNSTNVSYHA
jgi:hypothetical protein